MVDDEEQPIGGTAGPEENGAQKRAGGKLEARLDGRRERRREGGFDPCGDRPVVDDGKRQGAGKGGAVLPPARGCAREAHPERVVMREEAGEGRRHHSGLGGAP